MTKYRLTNNKEYKLLIFSIILPNFLPKLYNWYFPVMSASVSVPFRWLFYPVFSISLFFTQTHVKYIFSIWFSFLMINKIKHFFKCFCCHFPEFPVYIVNHFSYWIICLLWLIFRRLIFFPLETNIFCLLYQQDSNVPTLNSANYNDLNAFITWPWPSLLTDYTKNSVCPWAWEKTLFMFHYCLFT